MRGVRPGAGEAWRLGLARPFRMIGLKRFIRPGLVISVVAHAAALLLGLHFVGADTFTSVPPDAMVVEIVPPDEAPRLQGTPSDLRSSGSHSQPQSNSATATAQSPPPKPAPQSPQQPQQRPDPQHNARQAAAQPQTKPAGLPAAETAQSDIPQAQTAQLDPEKSDTAQAQTSEPPPSPPQPQHEETPDQPTPAETFAQEALLGGPLGGGFDAPPVDTTQAADDITLAFRERVSSCSAVPAGMSPNDKISVAMRVVFNRDGTLASTPRPLEPITSAKQQALMQNSIEALQKCQPYTMLPPAKYKQWKTMELTFYPMDFFASQ
jgi:hypothetical protein